MVLFKTKEYSSSCLLLNMKQKLRQIGLEHLLFCNKILQNLHTFGGIFFGSTKKVILKYIGLLLYFSQPSVYNCTDRLHFDVRPSSLH